MNADSMSEADLIKSFTHDRPEPTTQPPTERPDILGVNVCHICGQSADPEMFHPTKQECINALRVRVERLERALNELACWRQGAEVTGDFDDPYSARLAREALA
jgi:hypothetical protein